MRQSRLGLSLPETLISLFLLTGLILVVIQLFHTGMRYHRWAENRAIASSLLTSKLEELRGWSNRPGGTGYNVDDGSAHNGVTDTSNFGFEVTTTVLDQVVYSPSSAFESSEPNARALNSSLK